MDSERQLGDIVVAVFDGPGSPFRLENLPLPSFLRPGDTLVRIDLATICGSDLHTILGKRIEPTPTVLGHEGVGTVVAAGGDRQQWLTQRVSWSSSSGCGGCRACLEWRLPQKCRSVLKYGHSVFSREQAPLGTYASHILLDENTGIVAVPSHVSDATAAPLNCSLATMVNVTECLPLPCRVAFIQGAGLLGLHGCALLRAAGVARVLISDPDQARLAAAAQFGGEPVDPNEVPANFADVAIEVAGAAGLFNDAMRILRPGGHYLMAGGVHPDSEIQTTSETIIRKCLSIRGFHNYSPRHLLKAADFIASSQLPWDSLVSPVFSLRDLDQAVALARTGRWARVAVRFSS